MHSTTQVSRLRLLRRFNSAAWLQCHAAASATGGQAAAVETPVFLNRRDLPVPQGAIVGLSVDR